MTKEELDSVFSSVSLSIDEYKPGAYRPLTLTSGQKLTTSKFMSRLSESLGKNIMQYPDLVEAVFDSQAMSKLLAPYSKVKEKNGIPEEFEGLSLYADITAKTFSDSLFLATQKGTVSVISAFTYLRLMGLKETEVIGSTPKVLPMYLPRVPKGDIQYAKVGNEEIPIFNTYRPPTWEEYPYLTALPDKLPLLFKNLIDHLFPLEVEREYFFSWLHHCMFSRAYVYLVLCGAPGTGKNTLKLVIRALCGHWNTTDGKRSTIVDKFNSQLSESTFAFFDELNYGSPDLENTMKEIQNDSVSIEKKGVDATRSTKIYSSIILANNRPRDNYIHPESRKFAPLVLTTERLEKSLTPEEINILIKKVNDPASETYDNEFIAQIAMWVKKNGKSDKWPNLEYRGPMFYRLCLTSLSAWQKDIVISIRNRPEETERKVIWVEGKGFLWSTLSKDIFRKAGRPYAGVVDFNNVRHFLDMFVDMRGQKCFKTLSIENEAESQISGDFYVRKIPEVEMMSRVKNVDPIEINSKPIKEESTNHDKPTSEEETRTPAPRKTFRGLRKK